MPKDNLTILGERLRAARNKANLTQEQLSDRSHVSIKHIAGIEKGQKNPSFEILQALAEALDLSLDNLIMKNLSAEEQDLNQLKTYYHSCPPEMRETLLNTVQALTKELTALAEKMDKDYASGCEYSSPHWLFSILRRKISLCIIISNVFVYSILFV